MTPRGALGGRELRDHVVGAADLERAGRLQAFALRKNGRPAGPETSMSGVTRASRLDAFGRGADLVESDHPGGCSCLGHRTMAIRW